MSKSSYRAASLSEALRRFLSRKPERVTSALARVEVLRAVRAQGEAAMKRAVRVLARVRLLRIEDGVLEAAASLDPRVLRSLDAIHIASARELGGDLESLITYDRRMAEATTMLGMSVRAPGTVGDRERARPRRSRPRPIKRSAASKASTPP